MHKLPKPHYQRSDSDPDWLAYAAQFHGHLGPWAAAGLRAGMTARRAVDADGYFDVDVTVEGPFVKPPRSCFLDGLQVSTGATLGKRNLKWVKAEQVIVRIENTRSGKTAEVRPTPALLKLLASIQSRPKATRGKDASERDQHDDHDDHEDHGPQSDFLEAVARKIAAIPDKKILHVTFPTSGE
ncbi:MAG: hypothetical protein HQ567_15940 [Candidatus Nealsonbacteria bacterium]|nr:hypothetical protein [Candidatus Nealsonbacteria bacterium]